jgi:diacylglycerol O-acyltransferase
MAFATSRRLSAHDSVFLDWERPEQPMHVAEIMVYEGQVTADEVVRMLDERMHLIPRYRQRIVRAPFDLAQPTWEDDPSFDVRNHVDERRIPEPGDERALSALCGELYCELLDRDRPLWQVTVLDGLATGGTVLFVRLHHSMVDGVSSVELIEVLHSTTQSAPVRPKPAVAWEPRPLPSAVTRLRSAIGDLLEKPLEAAGEVTGLVRPGAPSDLVQRIGDVGRMMLDAGPQMLAPLSATPFNAPISPARDVAWVELEFAETQQVRKALGGTVNDLVLAVLSGGIARYMKRHGYPTDKDLLALCPVSVRRPDQSGEFGNQISMVVAPLHIGVEDGAARLAAERASMQRLKERRQASGFHEVISLSEWLPALLFKWVWKLWPSGYFPLHVTSTNVPGPRQPLYLGKHELLHWYPFGVQWTNNALFLCTLTYREFLVLGPVVDPNVIADVWEFADDLRASYEEIRDAAGVSGGAPTDAPRKGKGKGSLVVEPV